MDLNFEIENKLFKKCDFNLDALFSFEIEDDKLKDIELIYEKEFLLIFSDFYVEKNLETFFYLNKFFDNFF